MTRRRVRPTEVVLPNEVFGAQLGIVCEMIETMETQTGAGQRHTMGKVVSFLREQMGRRIVVTSARNEMTISQLVDQLTREAARPAPDVQQFIERATLLIVFLLAVST